MEVVQQSKWNLADGGFAYFSDNAAKFLCSRDCVAEGGKFKLEVRFRFYRYIQSDAVTALEPSLGTRSAFLLPSDSEEKLSC
jgi:hypothetical protein